MEQLISIKNIPIKLDFETTPMKVQVSKSISPQLEIKRERGGLEIKNAPKRDIIDISKGPHVVPVRTSSVNSENCSVKSSGTEESSALDNSVSLTPVTSSTSPKGPNINLNELSMQFKMDKLKFEYRTKDIKREFIPSNIEYRVVQYPDVLIDFIGDMIYAPPSANPNYEQQNEE